MAVSGGRVTWIGEDRVGRALHSGAEEFDLAGSFVTPGFVDTHVHSTAAGLALTGLDLTGAQSRTDCLRLVREHCLQVAREQPAGSLEGVIWGHGWDASRWTDARPPSTAELDEASGARAIYLTRIDAHSAAASSELRSKVPGLHAAAGYSPDGPLTATAHHLVRAVAGISLSNAQRDRAQRAFLDQAASRGIVCVHECAGPNISDAADLRRLLELDHGVQVRAYWGETVERPEQARALLSQTGAHGLAGDVFIDGALGSHTAWLHEPYSDNPGAGTGNAYLGVDQIAAHIRACTLVGVQAGFHVIGDAAVSAAVEAFGRVVDELGLPALAACGHRLDHLEMVNAEQAAKLGTWGVIASMQPLFDGLWGGPDGLYVQRLGSVRGVRLNPFSMLAAAGVSLAFSSDAPVTPLEPWAAIRAAVQHRTEGLGVSPRAAFAATTRGGWRAGGIRDGVAGTLVPGAPASYAIWDTSELVVSAPAKSVQRWSTDPRSRVPALPCLDPDAELPVCLATVHRGATLYERGI